MSLSVSSVRALTIENPGRELVLVERLDDLGIKLEGVDATLAHDGVIHLPLVADADDPSVASPPLSATLPAR